MSGRQLVRPACGVWIVAALAGAVGCEAQQETINTVFDACEPLVLTSDDADSNQRTRMRAGLAMWNERANTQLSLAPLDEALPDAAKDAPQIPVHFDDAGSSFHGYYDDDEGVVYINDDLVEPRACAVTVAHEVGHAFGLVHVDEAERISVMNIGNLQHEPNSDDVLALAELWGRCRRSP